MTEDRSFLETLSTSEKPESFEAEKFVRVDNRDKMKKRMVAFLLCAVVLAGLTAAYMLSTRVEVPQMVGMTLTEAKEWAQKNKVVLSARSIYQFDVEEGVILTQDVTAEEKVARNSTVTLEVSLGPSPDEAVAFPDIMAMTQGEVEAWITDNKLTGAKVETAYSTLVEADHVIGYSFTDGSKTSFLRKNRVTVSVSLGEEAQSATVVAPDFSTMKAAAVLQWGAENGVSISLTEAFDSYVAAGSVVSQSINKEVEMSRAEMVTVVISKGKSVSVPALSAMTKEEATNWAKLNNTTLTVLEKYTDSVAKGKLYGQNRSSGSSMEEGEEIVVSYSLGKVEVADYVGKTKLDILNWQSTVNMKAGGIALEFSEDYGAQGSAGNIISQSVRNDYVSPGTRLNVVISKGMKLAVPALAGMPEADCSKMAKETGLEMLFDYAHSATVEKGLVISQTIAPDTIITDVDVLTVTVSLGA